MFHIFFLRGGGAGPGTLIFKEMGHRSTLNRDQDSTGEIRSSNLFRKVRAPLYLEGSGFRYIWRGQGSVLFGGGQGSAVFGGVRVPLILRDHGSALF